MENIYARSYVRPTGGRLKILEDLCTLKKLENISVLPTIRQVSQNYEWWFNQLKAGGANPRFIDVSEHVERDVKSVWEKASLGNVLVSTRRFQELLQNLRNRIKKLKAQPKTRLNHPLFLSKLDDLCNDADKLFDICTCKCSFPFDGSIKEDDIPCCNKYRTKVKCDCIIEKRVHPRELKFLLDQRGERVMYIGPLDRIVTQDNLRLQSNRRAKADPIASTSTSSPREVFDYDLDPLDDIEIEPNKKNDPDYTAKLTESKSLVSPNICKHTDRHNVSLRSIAFILNDAADTLGCSNVAHTTIFYKKQKLRTDYLEQAEELGNNLPFQYCFDGKQLFGRERLAGLIIHKDSSYFATLKTFRASERCTSSRCTEFILAQVKDVQNMICLMADTCSLNTGSKNGIFRQIENHMKRNYDKDILALQCLYHVNELLLHKVITHFDGSTTSGSSLQGDAVYNSIKLIKESDLVSTNLIKDCNVKPSLQAQQFLSELLDRCLDAGDQTSKTIRDDQAVMLVLSCATFREIPKPSDKITNLHKYLFYRQETLSHARWITTANGYLRLKLFDLFNFSDTKTNHLDNIVKFIISVYAPTFCNIYTHPKAVQGAKIVLDIRNLMKSCGDVALPAKACFMDHAITWTNPKTVALSLLDDDPPLVDIERLTLRDVNTRELLWSNRQLPAFFNGISASSPALTVGTFQDWRSFQNNNMSCERLINQLKGCILAKKIVDSNDADTDEKIAAIDKRIRAYVNYSYY